MVSVAQDIALRRLEVGCRLCIRSWCRFKWSCVHFGVDVLVLSPRVRSTLCFGQVQLVQVLLILSTLRS